MSDSNFTPKLGRIRDPGRARPLRHAKRIIGEAAKVRVRPARFAGHIGPNGLRRGLAQGRVFASGLFVPGARRVIVRARYTRQKAGELGAARAHLRYIQRYGVTREGKSRAPLRCCRRRRRWACLPPAVSTRSAPVRFIVSAEDSIGCSASPAVAR
jgi:hypothetical protein